MSYNIHDFLMQNAESMQYALVEYDGTIEAVYFVQHSHNGKPWFLESPCNPCKEHEFADNENIEEWCLSMADELLEPDVDRKEYYKEFMKPLIVGNILYDIYCPQVAPYLPKEVDDIILITERECLLYLLDMETVESLKLKRDSKGNLRNSLIDTGSFDANTIDKIMDVYSNTAADYSFKRK